MCKCGMKNCSCDAACSKCGKKPCMCNNKGERKEHGGHNGGGERKDYGGHNGGRKENGGYDKKK